MAGSEAEAAVGAELAVVLKCKHGLVLRPLQASQVDEAHALEAASYPADEAASHEGFTFRQKQAVSSLVSASVCMFGTLLV